MGMIYNTERERHVILTLGSDMLRERERERHDSVWPLASGDVKVAVKLRRRPTAQHFSTSTDAAYCIPRTTHPPTDYKAL